MTAAADSRSADILIRNARILPMTSPEAESGVSPGIRMIENGSLAVAGDTIAALGTAEEMTDWTADRVIDAENGLLLPGLVNAHTHAAMTCFRGLADDLPLMSWLNDHIFPAEARLRPEIVKAGSLLAAAEMMLSGTTCCCDMYLYEDSVAAAMAEAGMRAVVGEVLFDFPSPAYGEIEKGFAHTARLLEKWKGHPLVSVAVEPHSPYLCAPELLEHAAGLAREHEALIVIHVSETKTETARINEKYGCSPVAHLHGLGVLGPDLLACHCVVLSAEDIALLADHEVKVVHNPESNMKLASGIAPVPDMLDAGICVALGTDGAASNNDLDLFTEMDTTAKLHKAARLDPSVMPASAVLRMATVDGARALGLDRFIGTLVPGKQADMILVRTDAPRMTPLYHPDSALVYAASGADVDTVLIAGRVVVDRRRVTTMDLDAVRAGVREIAARYMAGLR